MPSSSLPTGTVSHARGDRTRPTDSDSDVDAPRRPTVRGQRLAVHDGGSQSRPDPSRTDVDEMTARIDELEEEVAFLERELDRREADHQEIIHRYEHVLAESNASPTHERGTHRSPRVHFADFVDRTKAALSPSRTTDTRRQADDRPLRERVAQLLPWR